MNPLFQQYGGQQMQPEQPQQQTVPINPNVFQNAANQVQNFLQRVGNPQQMIQQIMSSKGVPAEIQNDPDQIIGYLQQNNMLNPVQKMALQYFRGRR